MDVLAQCFCFLFGAPFNASGGLRFPGLKVRIDSTLRRPNRERNALVMRETLPPCPNCVQPMRLTRRIGADQTYCGQDVFECSPCRVAMTQPARSEPRTETC